MTSNSDDDLIAALSDIIDSMFSDYDRSTRDNLRAVLSGKLTRPSGTSLRELTAAVQNIRPFEAREKAELIAKTISFGASNLANRRAWQQSGVVKKLNWFAADGAEMCGLCASLSRKNVSVNDCFLKKGDVVTGNNGASIIIAQHRSAAASRRVPLLLSAGRHFFGLKKGRAKSRVRLDLLHGTGQAYGCFADIPNTLILKAAQRAAASFLQQDAQRVLMKRSAASRPLEGISD